jgi:hypothetical protein
MGVIRRHQNRLSVLQDNSSMIVKQNDRNIFRLHFYHVLVVFLLTAITVMAQTPDPSGAPVEQAQAAQPNPQSTEPPAQQPGVLAPGKTDQGEDKYILGVLPNYRTAEMSAIGHPLTAKQKLTIAAKDSFAPTLMGIGAIYALLYQAEDNHPEFGQGVEGYAKRFGCSYADQVIGNFMTEGIFPSMLKQDPRYFRMAHGSVGKRTWYALSRIVVTKTDAGRSTLNASELLGNAAAAGIGLAYYPDSRDTSDYMENWGTQLATDAASQVLKEFWPDVKSWWHKKRHANENAPMSEVPPGQSH